MLSLFQPPPPLGSLLVGFINGFYGYLLSSFISRRAKNTHTHISSLSLCSSQANSQFKNSIIISFCAITMAAFLPSFPLVLLDTFRHILSVSWQNSIHRRTASESSWGATIYYKKKTVSGSGRCTRCSFLVYYFGFKMLLKHYIMK